MRALSKVSSEPTIWSGLIVFDVELEAYTASWYQNVAVKALLGTPEGKSMRMLNLQAFGISYWNTYTFGLGLHEKLYLM